MRILNPTIIFCLVIIVQTCCSVQSFPVNEVITDDRLVLEKLIAEHDTTNDLGGYANSDGNNLLQSGVLKSNTNVFVHKLAPIIIERKANEITVDNEQTLLVKPAPVIIHRPRAVEVRPPVVYTHRQQPIYLRPKIVQVVRPIRKKYFIETYAKEEPLPKTIPPTLSDIGVGINGYGNAYVDGYSTGEAELESYGGLKDVKVNSYDGYGLVDSDTYVHKV